MKAGVLFSLIVCAGHGNCRQAGSGGSHWSAYLLVHPKDCSARHTSTRLCSCLPRYPATFTSCDTSPTTASRTTVPIPSFTIIRSACYSADEVTHHGLSPTLATHSTSLLPPSSSIAVFASATATARSIVSISSTELAAVV